MKPNEGIQLSIMIRRSHSTRYRNKYSRRSEHQDIHEEVVPMTPGDKLSTRDADPRTVETRFKYDRRHDLTFAGELAS